MLRAAIALIASCLALACNAPPRAEREAIGGARTRVVLKMQPLWGDLAPFHALVAEFERAHPNVQVVTELIPNASDLAHQFYLTALEGRSQDFDVLVADIVWVPEFARAGWIADLSRDFPESALKKAFLPGAVTAALVDGKTFAVPWFVDVGLLYYRKDLVPRAPRTYTELIDFARAAMRTNPRLTGYVWQGRQYEGLTCNVFEAIWGHGGEPFRENRLLLTETPAYAALAYLRDLMRAGISPPSVGSAAEEEARLLFQEGRAVFMRNWPYAFALLEAQGSPVRGRVGVAPLPSASGAPGSGTLGGYHLALNAHTPPERRALAIALIRHLTSHEANLMMAVHYARNPPRRAVYEDPELLRRAPFIAGLAPALERARPRPVTPYYVLLADILQSEFSAAVHGIRSPEDAMARAQNLADHLMEGAP